MSLQFKGISEYKRNFKWTNSKRSRSCSPLSNQKVPWAGLPSEQLGNTREPNFISKKRVLYHTPQVSQSFHWDWNSDSGSKSHEPIPKVSDLVKQRSSAFNKRETEKAQDNQEESKTPNAPRKPKVARSQSADCHLHSALEPSLSEDKQLAIDAQKEKEDNTSSRKEGAEKAVRNGIIHARNKHVSPFKLGKVFSETEYSSQFRGMQLPKGPRLRKDFEALAFEQENRSPQKSAGSISKGQQQDTEEQQLQDQQLLNQQNPKKSPFSRKGLRHIKSEYRTNFRPPSQYDYKRGVFRSEGVKELREKAEAYKRRALGTHFSRDHLIQILSEQNKLWEASSTSDTEESVSDTVEALDLARAKGTPNISSTQRQEICPGSEAQSTTLPPPPKATTKYNDTRENAMPDVPTLPVSRRLAWTDEEEKPCRAELPEGNQDQNDETEKEVEVKRNAEAEAVNEREPAPVNIQDAATVKSESNEQSELGSSAGGRLPTPTLKTTSGVQRTHHDLTTPAVGGAVLVSPCKVRSPSPHRRRTQPPLGKQYSPYKYLSESPSKMLRKSESLQKSPAAGVKTSDPIPLREEYGPANFNSPSPEKAGPSILPSMKMHPVFNPKSSVTLSPSWSCPHRIQGTLRHPEFQHNGNTGGLRANLLRMQSTDPAAADNEDDRMSQISARSAASSSLASQVLERAQKRRENFWGKNP
ncbi:nuclear protein MDM1 isoform X2 [Mustelus asterias]